jgi:hypothetical protein
MNNPPLNDLAKPDRKRLISSLDWEQAAEHLATTVIVTKAVNTRLQQAMEQAINWLDLGAPSRARDALLEATRE